MRTALARAAALAQPYGRARQGREFLPERPGVLLIQIDLVLRATKPEPHRLTGRAPAKIIF
jgi:hypothetical protein